MKFSQNSLYKASIGALLSLIYALTPLNFCSANALLQERTLSDAQISLFAKTGSGDYYTLYPEGLEKEDSYIGGFKSAQLDPLQENIYFFDTVLKVIAKINLKDGKVYKVIGKPKGNTASDFTNPMKFSDANLGPLSDFVLDKCGNLFILYSADKNNNIAPRILKASLKDQSIKEILVFNDYFLPPNSSSINFTLNNLSYDHNRFVYITGSLTNYGSIVLKFDPLTNTSEFYAAKKGISAIGFTPKYALSDSQYLTVTGFAVDYNNACYLSTNDYRNSQWSYYTEKLTQSNDQITNTPFVGDGSGSLSDIGDGGSAKSAYVSLSGPRCLCGDTNGDIYIADTATNRIRKIFNDSGLITTVIGGGTESIKFGESKPIRNIQLQSPNSILVDKTNNLYVIESSRILQVPNLITVDSNASQLVKLAGLSITKIAGKDVLNPKGTINIPDLSLDYTYAGDQTVEVKGQNIPDGTNVKLLTTNADGSTNSTVPAAKLTGGIASIPVKVEAGTSKIIKAETDPFIPAPGVYLPGTEPNIAAGQLPSEPALSKANRDAVNATGNLIPSNMRFNFTYGAGWQRSDGWWDILTKSNTAIDPDNVIADSTYLSLESYAPTVNSDIYYDSMAGIGKNITFSVWMRTDSGNISIPIGVAPNAASSVPNAQYYYSWIADNYLQYTPLYSYITANVTPVWQKFTFTSNSNITSYPKQIYIGGLGNTKLQKVYIWGARLEEVQ